MKRLFDRPSLLPALALLNLPLLLLAPFLLKASAQWALPFSAGLEVPPGVSSSLAVAWKPLCQTGQAVGLEASTSAGLGGHDIQFANPATAAAWKTQLAPAPFPQIHARARLAQVPVLTYQVVGPSDARSDARSDAPQGLLAVTPAELAEQFQRIRAKGLTPITLSQMVEHLRTGIPLPAKPIVLTFENPQEHQAVQALLKQYEFPAALAIDPTQIQAPRADLDSEKSASDTGLTWAQVKALAADPRITIASTGLDANALSAPPSQLQQTLNAAKQTLELQIGRSVPYFLYPSLYPSQPSDPTADPAADPAAGPQIQQAIQQAGYQAAWGGTGALPETLLNLQRQSPADLDAAIEQANGGPPLRFGGEGLNFQAPVQLTRRTTSGVPLILAAGGKPVTIHAKTRDQVAAIVADSPAVAAVDGTFFSLESLDSNQMVGPVLSRDEDQFFPGSPGENPLLQGRPLVLISDQTIKLVPYDAQRHTTRTSLSAELPGVTDAFVGAGWLVRDGKPQDVASFGRLYSVNEERDRAFWGIDWADRAVVGVSAGPVGSVKLGEALSQAGLRDVVMLDSGASASLVYQKESMMGYLPRPVPHVVALYPPSSTNCPTSPVQGSLPRVGPL
jgi:poly-beta-1,6-N-acetyl-D-glucosamine N-deacetylase